MIARMLDTTKFQSMMPLLGRIRTMLSSASFSPCPHTAMPGLHSPPAPPPPRALHQAARSYRRKSSHAPPRAPTQVSAAARTRSPGEMSLRSSTPRPWRSGWRRGIRGSETKRGKGGKRSSCLRTLLGSPRLKPPQRQVSTPAILGGGTQRCRCLSRGSKHRRRQRVPFMTTCHAGSMRWARAMSISSTRIPSPGSTRGSWLFSRRAQSLLPRKLGVPWEGRQTAEGSIGR
mmetsp:Transcript_10264/g.33922  ORF Transcript_10264/g.33922 Transcript_10264/m.33922 type:complete len:231 (+) Transcript_10264:532-1224(+)